MNKTKIAELIIIAISALITLAKDTIKFIMQLDKMRKKSAVRTC